MAVKTGSSRSFLQLFQPVTPILNLDIHEIDTQESHQRLLDHLILQSQQQQVLQTELGRSGFLLLIS